MSLPRVANFQDLIVYQKSRAFQREIFQLSRSFPREENFSLTDQIHRSSRSIGANIAEAWAKPYGMIQNLFANPLPSISPVMMNYCSTDPLTHCLTVLLTTGGFYARRIKSLAN